MQNYQQEKLNNTINDEQRKQQYYQLNSQRRQILQKSMGTAKNDNEKKTYSKAINDSLLADWIREKTSENGKDYTKIPDQELISNAMNKSDLIKNNLNDINKLYQGK
jgi:hypothetical protein